MAVELVIKISEKIYNALTHTEFDANLVVNEMRKSIVNGTPLPKGHGRLIDASKILTVTQYDGENEKTYVLFDHAPTIIKADKEKVYADDSKRI